ncbi:MAG: FAD-dependent oxidoreductase [Desulfobacterales bacterium]|nr:FAD-dependent oxidoreductase [Desulfobacterales bacterium]
MNKTGSWRFFHPKYEEKTAPCSAACPVGQDIPRIEMLAARGLFKDAWQTILTENPFPAVCGRVCFHPCETVCNRANLDENIAISNLERFLGDTVLAQQKKPDLVIKPPSGKKVAIAGAGPAGLAAAYFLSRLGYGCDVFEASSEPGGLLRWGIPAYRLPRHILSHEIGRIENLGAGIHCGKPVSRGLLDKIYTEYDAFFIGCGYGQSIELNIEGGDLACLGLDFLSKIRHEEKMSFRDTAVIVGGGNTAVDVARTLIRLGASALIVYRRRRDDMPAFKPEVAAAVKEGVRIMELVAPIRFQEMPGDTSSTRPDYRLTLQQMKVSKKSIGNRARVIPDGEKTKTITAQSIFVAIGAETDALWHFPKADESKTLNLSHCKFIEQKLPVVYGGDLTSPVKSVTDAIASGKQAAMALDTYFNHGIDAVEKQLTACQVGAGPALSMSAYLGEDRQFRNAHIVDYDEIVNDYFPLAPRLNPRSLDAEQSIQSFAEINATFETKAAKDEAARCFNCGICNACDYCRLYCPEMAVKVAKAERWIDMDYCKGCGVCATECPRNAMALEEEIK